MATVIHIYHYTGAVHVPTMAMQLSAGRQAGRPQHHCEVTLLCRLLFNVVWPSEVVWQTRKTFPEYLHLYLYVFKRDLIAIQSRKALIKFTFALTFDYKRTKTSKHWRTHGRSNGSITQGEDPLGYLSSGQNKIECPFRCLASRLNAIKCPLTTV